MEVCTAEQLWVDCAEQLWGIWILCVRLDLDYTTTSKKKKCLLILRGAVRVDYVTTGQKKVSIDFERVDEL